MNYAAEQSFLRVDADAKTITLELKIDTTISHVMEYFEIFLGRMMMCRRAADDDVPAVDNGADGDANDVDD